MERSHEAVEDVIELGAVSAETKGAPIGNRVDSKGLLRQEGLSDD